MSIYYCEECQQQKNNNWVPMNDVGVCEDCVEKMDAPATSYSDGEEALEELYAREGR